MKKILSIISTIIIIISSINLVSYADCNMNINYKKLIDFSEVINDDDLKSISQTIDDKEVKIIRYDEIVNIKGFFNSKIKSNEEEINRIQNMEISPGALYYFLEIARNLITNQSTTASQTSNETVSKISLNDLKRLAEKGESNSTTQGKLQGALMSLTTYGSSIMGTLNTILKISKEGFKGLKDPSKLTWICVLSALGGFAYNLYFISQENKVSRLIDVYKNIKRQVYEGITDHKWIGNNVLITAIPTDNSCTKGYADFHNVDGIRYSKSQDAINWEFAKAECKFLNADHDDCYQEAKKTIDCLWDNLEDPSKCKNNPYYHPYSEDD